MRYGVCAVATGILAVGPAMAQEQPPKLSLMQDHESVYAPPEPERPDAGVNEGGVHFGLEVRYMTDYIYRGVEIFDDVGDHEDAPNFQIDGLLSWDLGKLPHPFVGVFVNVYESDPISNFQEIRPYLGLDWNLRPLLLTGGQVSYLYPDRDDMNTGEVYGQIKLDDSYFFKTDAPILSPYIYAAYDYDLYHGWYFEAGVSHDFVIEDWGIVIRAEAEVAYVHNNQFFTAEDDVDTGFQHYQFGLIGKYSLNNLLNVSRRYGEWQINGYLYYTDGIDNDLEAENQIWGGAGIGFQY